MEVHIQSIHPAFLSLVPVDLAVMIYVSRCRIYTVVFRCAESMPLVGKGTGLIHSAPLLYSTSLLLRATRLVSSVIITYPNPKALRDSL